MAEAPTDLEEARVMAKAFEAILAEKRAADRERVAKRVMPAYHSRSITADARLLRACRDDLPILLRKILTGEPK